MQPKGRPVRKSDLAAPARRLLELMQRTGHARIEGLIIQGGQPVLTPPPKVIQKVRMENEGGSESNVIKSDFVLKQPLVRFFDVLERVGDGMVRSVEVQDGLPLSMEIETEPGLQ
jgi:hypothetical protein